MSISLPGFTESSNWRHLTLTVVSADFSNGIPLDWTCWVCVLSAFGGRDAFGKKFVLVTGGSPGSIS